MLPVVNLSVLLVCGGEIQNPTGQFSSPGYPATPYIPEHQYDDNPRCNWRMRPQAPNVSVILLTFKRFFLGRKEEGGHCRYELFWYIYN